jgi:PilZ domain.
MEGHTSDVSATGVGLIVPAIRIGEHYLVGEEQRLHLKLELPTGPVDLDVSPVRYESLEEDPEETGYVIGVRITDMNEADRKRFHEYIQTLLSKQGSS